MRERGCAHHWLKKRKSLPASCITGFRSRRSSFTSRQGPHYPMQRSGGHTCAVIRQPLYGQFSRSCGSRCDQGDICRRKARTAEFQVAADERYFQARIVALPKAFGRCGHRRSVMQFQDRTAKCASDVMRTDLVANASHELRTLLASVLGYVETSRSGAQEIRKFGTSSWGSFTNKASGCNAWSTISCH